MVPYFEIVEGPDKGRKIELKEGTEIILGRSSESDVTLIDPILSRRHCRVDLTSKPFKVFDLESANGSFINGNEITSSSIFNGDKLNIGDTVLVLVIPEEDVLKSTAGVPGVVVDLGFDSKDGDLVNTPKTTNWRPFVWGLAAVAILIAGVSAIARQPKQDEGVVIQQPKEPSLLPFEVEYEKVEASTNGIFRYHMSLSDKGLLSIEIDDIVEDRHIRKDAVVSSNSVLRLAKLVERSDFYRSDAIPAGIAPEGRLNTMEISIVSNRKAQRLVVENRNEPPAFQEVRDALETFGMNELGIWAIQYPKEKLVEMANDTFVKARNLYEERGISHGNIYRAVKSYEESLFYLETIEPKPEFYQEVVSGKQIAEEELTRRYEEQRFKADRAINLKDWQTAAMELRIIREQIPNDDDLRSSDALKKLLDVENRIKKGNK